MKKTDTVPSGIVPLGLGFSVRGRAPPPAKSRSLRRPFWRKLKRLRPRFYPHLVHGGENAPIIDITICSALSRDGDQWFRNCLAVAPASFRESIAQATNAGRPSRPISATAIRSTLPRCGRLRAMRVAHQQIIRLRTIYGARAATARCAPLMPPMTVRSWPAVLDETSSWEYVRKGQKIMKGGAGSSLILGTGLYTIYERLRLSPQFEKVDCGTPWFDRGS